MIFRFPPAQADPHDKTFLSDEGKTFAKLKIETKAGKRTVFLTEHTLIFVIEGTKLLHFAGETVRVEKGNILLLKKGIYAMAEYIEDGLRFEALMVFLHGKVIGSMLSKQTHLYKREKSDQPFYVFKSNEHFENLKNQMRYYFDNPLFNAVELFSLKQKEVLLLLINAGNNEVINRFIQLELNSKPANIESVLDAYLLQPVTISELAVLSNRSLASFKRDFHGMYNSSPRKWINAKRAAHALLLIRNTNRSVSEIAYECGFENLSYFISVFKKIYNITPAAVRKQITTFPETNSGIKNATQRSKIAID